jgi:hypothetical protein
MIGLTWNEVVLPCRRFKADKRFLLAINSLNAFVIPFHLFKSATQSLRFLCPHIKVRFNTLRPIFTVLDSDAA